MRFSEYFKIQPTHDDDWFDTYLPMDTNLFVDPFLIYDDTDPCWATAHDHILDFFGVVFGLVRESGGDEHTMAWQKARRLLMFPEPSEFCLGVAAGSPMGSGSGAGLQEGMLEGVRTALGHGLDNILHLEMLALFQGGVGLDRLSDAVCNILKSYFIQYTQEVCKRHAVPMQTIRVRNAKWSEKYARWQDKDVQLPINPFINRPHPILLAPRRFLKDLPIATANGFWRYAWNNHSGELRGDFNYDIASSVDRRIKATLARQNPEVVAGYLDDLAARKHDPYPVDTDPKLRTRWWELGTEMAENSPLPFTSTGPEKFANFIAAVIEAFQHNIERQGGWQVLWHENNPRPEKTVQQLFRSSVIHYCRANNVELTSESDIGRGLVDFKFPQGRSARALVEMKLMNNSSFWNRILLHTRQYTVSEEVKVGYFVAVAYTDQDMSVERMDKIKKAAEMASKKNRFIVRPIVIDARRKDSASKLEVTPKIRSGLHNKKPTDQEAPSEQNAA